jgi:hypothetical protein
MSNRSRPVRYVNAEAMRLRKGRTFGKLAAMLAGIEAHQGGDNRGVV